MLRIKAVGTFPLLGLTLHAAEAFIITEEENLVLDYGTAGGSSELVLAEFAFLDAGVVFKVVGGVEFVVAEELPCGAVERVGSGLDGCVQHRTGRTARVPH